ncbi:MAG: NUDIX domain-containing protein [Gemmatimonadales bacterium]|nr:NUDIX domain-containing protein [Candidatus Palauibacter irciniicola]MYC19665.1 NUDIX domain-containing protein [Gemmatimonadales bacterium]
MAACGRPADRLRPAGDPARHRPRGKRSLIPRPAATVVVATQARTGLDFLLLQRPADARFGAGAWAFPGGAIDADDARATWADRLPGVGESAACVAALRELFEETGIVPASRGRVGSDALAGARRALLAESIPFSQVAERLELDFSSARMAYFARWITPRGAALRFDTRFFLLSLEERPRRVRLTPEHEAAIWTTPAAALRRFSAGRLPMMFPTARTIERLAGFRSVEEAMAALSDVQVEPALVRLGVGEDGVTPLAPGDPGYDEVR